MAETIPTMKGAATPVSTRQEEAVYYHPTRTSQARPTLLFYLSLVTSRLLSIYLACSASSFGLLSIIRRPAGLLGYCVFSLFDSLLAIGGSYRPIGSHFPRQPAAI